MATDSHIPKFDLNCRKFYHMSAKNFKGHHMVMTLNLSCTGILSHIYFLGKHGVQVIEHQIANQKVLGLSLIRATVLCP